MDFKKFNWILNNLESVNVVDLEKISKAISEFAKYQKNQEHEIENILWAFSDFEKKNNDWELNFKKEISNKLWDSEDKIKENRKLIEKWISENNIENNKWKNNFEKDISKKFWDFEASINNKRKWIETWIYEIEKENNNWKKGIEKQISDFEEWYIKQWNKKEEEITEQFSSLKVDLDSFKNQNKELLIDRFEHLKNDINWKISSHWIEISAQWKTLESIQTNQNLFNDKLDWCININNINSLKIKELKQDSEQNIKRLNKQIVLLKVFSYFLLLLCWVMWYFIYNQLLWS